MNIILMPDGEGRTTTLQLGLRHVVLLAAVLAVAISLFLGVGFFAGQRGTHTTMVVGMNQETQLDQLALRVGELQARLARISDIGDRVAKKSGIPLTEQDPIPGRGGPMIPASETPMDAETLASMLDDLTRKFDHENDRLTLLDAELLSRDAIRGHLPMDRPVDDTGFVSSTFGIRTDPFTGRRARHEGLDFSDAVGAPVLAAESGVVTEVRSSADYGNMVDIDHGNGLTTRYAHCRKALVKAGDVVKRGEKIAEIGNTGRSTGPHLHFEVRRNDVPQNPLTFFISHTASR